MFVKKGKEKNNKKREIYFKGAKVARGITSY
jgi:hypothetical protein